MRVSTRRAVGRAVLLVAALVTCVSSFSVTAFTQERLPLSQRPAPSPGTRTPITLQPVATLDPCHNAITDGGFEGGIPNPSWDPETSTNFGTPLCTVASCGTGNGTAPPRTGTIWAWFGGVPAVETATVGQTVAIAPHSSATLTFWMRIGVVSNPFTDVLNVRVDGTILQTFTEPAVAEGVYTQRTINLNAFADGGSHQLLFEYIGPTTGSANFTVDDVSLDVCGLPPAAGQKFAASMSPLQETPAPVGAPSGTGVGLVTLNAAGDQITVAMAYAGMSSTVILAHIHGSATSTPGTNGPIIFDLAPSGGTTGINTATTFPVTPAQVDLLRRSLLYVNVHTSNNPAGEIRGQLHLNDLAANIDVDGKPDAALFRPSTTTWYTLRSTNGTENYRMWGASTDTIVPGDYDGDARYDAAVWRPSNSTWYIEPSFSGAQVISTFGTTGDIPVPADYDRDGKTDIAVFRPSSGTWFGIRSSDGGLFLSVFGQTGDRPMPADYDRDGRADFAVYRPTGGLWIVQNSSNGAIVTKQFGLSADTAAAADFDGDGQADFGVFRPAAGFWFIFQSTTNALTGYWFGTTGDVAVPGDFDSDAKADVAIFRPSSGFWFIRKSFESTPGAAVLQIIRYGTAGDQPVSTIYVK